jgi:allantoate deiminase
MRDETERAESLDASARVVMERCAALGGISEEHDRLTRRYGTLAMRAANDLVGTYMRAAGMEVRRDNIGNVIGRYAGITDDAPTLLLGSHLDTVRDAGRYDGPLGVLVAIAAAERLHARGERLPFAIEVYGFADEEGLRFHSAYLGSQALAGTLQTAENAYLLVSRDGEGVRFFDAVRDFGGDPGELKGDTWAGGPLLGYCEVHIEQGPVLEARELPVGVVTAIQGQTRTECIFMGQAGHAGTVPMDLRRDALCAASEFILKVETLARATPGLVATVGQLEVEPGASNVIPGQVRLSVDIRHPDDAIREAAQGQMLDLTVTERGVSVSAHLRQDSPAVTCDAHLAGLFTRAISEAGYPVLELPSGAGHDAVPLSSIAPVAMLFVRCKGGISHHPDESVTTEDVAVAIDVLERFLGLLAAKTGGSA